MFPTLFVKKRIITSAMCTLVLTQLHFTFYFPPDNRINHISAINPLDGTTCLHKTVEGGDNVTIANQLLRLDNTVANIQDSMGLTALHLACKLNRKKLVQLFIVSVKFLFLGKFKILGPSIGVSS